MKYIKEYSNPQVIRKLVDKIDSLMNNINSEINLMEVCGTHTMNIGRAGLRSILPSQLNLLSGPGCPVCVTPSEYITNSIEIAEMEDVIITTFGDMLKVPNSKGRSLSEYPSGKVRVVYTPVESLKIAGKSSSKEIVFLGVGFETTAPLIAETINMAYKNGLKNFSCYSAHKLIPPAIKALVNMPVSKIDGFILPGHVSVVIGEKGYKDLGIRGVVTGFEPVDILEGIESLLLQIREGKEEIQNRYKRAVSFNGNMKMQKIMYKIFKTADERWRGVGEIKNSGLVIRDKYQKYDTLKKFDISAKAEQDPPVCRCGDVLQGLCRPDQCSLFGKKCTPDNPVGPCMVSSEGACSAYYKYER